MRYLFVTRHILKKAKFASDMLHKPTNDLSNAIDLIATLKEELDVCRSRLALGSTFLQSQSNFV